MTSPSPYLSPSTWPSSYPGAIRPGDQLFARTGDALGHELIAARVRMDGVAFQRLVREDAPERACHQQASLLVRDAFVHRFVVGGEAREAKAEEHDHRPRPLDLAHDLAQIGLGARNRDAAEEVVPAEADDHDARIARENVG